MSLIKRAPHALCLSGALAILLGCQVAPTTTTTTTTTNAPANTSPTPPTIAQQPAPATQRDASARGVPVTLPVLDAFFADESFAGELKSRLQLNDEQVTRLREIARTETAGLRESDQADGQQGTTAAATARATEKIKGVIGDEKTEQLFALVRERWATGGAPAGAAVAALPDKPNNVPTDTRVVVNAPAYRMDVYKGGQLLKTYKVGIGYPEFPLPQGMRKADKIIFNPTWTPPDEPWVESSNKVKVGEKVEAGSPLNPLGPIKIPIGLPSLIHGGKSPAKLGGFASHGCVGLTSPQVQDFARVLADLSGTQLSAEDIAAYAKKKTETKDVPLAAPVPVELRYETIVVEDGRLHIYRDVYDRGTNTEENLRRVLDVYGVTLDELSAQERQQVTDALAQMARDATGKPAEGDGTANDNAAAAKSEKKNEKQSARVTSTIKGKKEIVIEIAALKGKGYPAPVNFDTGSGTSAQRPQAAKAGKK
jgi:lipoprotein-anchoring transpeptidase ErfK/SrfK